MADKVMSDEVFDALVIVQDTLDTIAGMLQQHTALRADVEHGQIILRTSRNGAKVKVLGTPEQAIAAANAAFLKAGTARFGIGGRA